MKLLLILFFFFLGFSSLMAGLFLLNLVSLDCPGAGDHILIFILYIDKLIMYF